MRDRDVNTMGIKEDKWPSVHMRPDIVCIDLDMLQKKLWSAPMCIFVVINNPGFDFFPRPKKL